MTDTSDKVAVTSKASDEEPCELCEGTGEYEEQPCPSCVSRELNEELVKVRAEVERLRAIENAAMRVASSFVKRNNTVDPLTMHKLDFALKNQKPTGNETGTGDTPESLATAFVTGFADAAKRDALKAAEIFPCAHIGCSEPDGSKCRHWPRSTENGSCVGSFPERK